MRLPPQFNMKKSTAEILKNFGIISLGSILYAASISLFLDPNKLVPGGVSGIAIIVNHLVAGVDTGVIMLAINLPLLIAGLIKFGKGFLFSTVYATVLSSVAVDLLDRFLAPYIPLTDDLLLAAIVGGALLALGLGLVFRAGGTTGGTDIVTKFIRLKYKHFKPGMIIMALDSMIILASAIAFRDIEISIYAYLSLIVSSFLIDVVLYGPDGAKVVYIISDKPEYISKRILAELEIGVTYLEGEGAYTGQGKRVIMCAARKHIFPKIREIVKDEDELAFMIVSSAQEIFGEGFKNHRSSDF